MDYRREYKRHCAESIDKALKEAVYEMYKDGSIPEKLFRILLDESIDDGDVYSYLVSKREFTKSSMELNSEFNQVRQKVNSYLIKIGFTNNICTKNSINTNRIYVIHQYDIQKDFLLKYFGLTPTELIPLMRRKGFMDKFCVLRLLQVFKEIYASLRVPEHIDHGYDKVFYNNSTQCFSIDYKYKVNINYIMDDDRMADTMDRIKKLDAIVEKQFEQKMSYAYFKDAYRDLQSKEIRAEIEEIVIPIRNGRRFMDIRRPELIVEEVAESEGLKLDRGKEDQGSNNQSQTISTQISVSNESSQIHSDKKQAEQDYKPVPNMSQKKESVPAANSAPLTKAKEVQPVVSGKDSKTQDHKQPTHQQNQQVKNQERDQQSRGSKHEANPQQNAIQNKQPKPNVGIGNEQISQNTRTDRKPPDLKNKPQQTNAMPKAQEDLPKQTIANHHSSKEESVPHKTETPKPIIDEDADVDDVLQRHAANTNNQKSNTSEKPAPKQISSKPNAPILVISEEDNDLL